MISGNDKYKDFIPSCSYSGNAHARDARKKEKECCKLLARVEELEDKLPRYVDTGEVFVPGRDTVYYVFDGEAYKTTHVVFYEEKWQVPVLRPIVSAKATVFYSSLKAALESERNNIKEQMQ